MRASADVRDQGLEDCGWRWQRCSRRRKPGEQHTQEERGLIWAMRPYIRTAEDSMSLEIKNENLYTSVKCSVVAPSGMKNSDELGTGQ